MAAPNAFHGQCKCCLKTTYLKNMWEPQENNGQWEVYGQMLVDCFGIDWTILAVEDDNICQVCISKLRVATNFKKQVLDSQAASLQEVDAVAAIEEVETTHRVQVETIPTLDGKEVEVNFVPTTSIKTMKPPLTKENRNKTSLEKENLNTAMKRDNSITVPSNTVNTSTILLKKENMTTLLLKKGNSVIVPMVKKEKMVATPLKKENTAAVPVKKENLSAITLKKENTTNFLSKEETTATYSAPISIKKETSNEISNIEEVLSEDNSTSYKNEKSVTYSTEIEKTDEIEQSFEANSGNEYENMDEDEKTFEVEFLEEEVLDQYEHNNDDEDFDPTLKKAKRPKGLPRGKRKMYKNYTVEDVRKAVQAVRSHQMSRSEAARVFKVPRETIGLKAQRNFDEEDSTKSVFMKQLVKAIRALVTFTNATPFKVPCQGNAYKCFYCLNEGPVLQHPNDLRYHTHTEHPDKIEHAEFAVRPPYLNQMVRFDISDLRCNCEEEVTWDNMLEHLQNTHGVTVLEEIWKKIVPYNLIPSEIIPCAFPSCGFSGCFNKLDTHMNVHFPNYLCGVCGKPYVTEYRLRGHMQYHQIGEYRCNECPLVFNSQIKRKVHKEKVHNKKLLYKCTFCQTRFESNKLKLEHLRTEHEDLLETKGRYCHLCGKSFWSRDFTRHMKFEHNKHLCQKCGKRFDRATRLKKHTCRPSSPVKNFKCAICMRLFFTKEAVLVHISQRHNETA